MDRRVLHGNLLTRSHTQFGEEYVIRWPLSCRVYLPSNLREEKAARKSQIVYINYKNHVDIYLYIYITNIVLCVRRAQITNQIQFNRNLLNLVLSRYGLSVIV